MRVTNFSSFATLHRGFSYLPGILTLADGRLSFVAHGSGEFWKYQLRALEKDAHQPSLAENLSKGKNAVVVDAPLTEVKITFNRLSSMKLVIGDLRCRIGFYDLSIMKDMPGASNDPLDAIFGLLKLSRLLPKSLFESSKSWKTAKIWRELLAASPKKVRKADRAKKSTTLGARVKGQRPAETKPEEQRLVAAGPK